MNRLALTLSTFALLSSSVAWSQSPVPSCSGVLSGDAISLVMPAAGGQVDSILNPWVPFTFNDAECRCGSTDLAMAVALHPSALPAGAIANTQLWVGTGCDNYAVRSSPVQTQCEQIMTSELNATSFDTGAPQPVIVHVPARALTSPQRHQCDASAASNSIYLFVIGSDPQNPDGACVLNLVEQLAGPDAPSNVTAAAMAGEDGAITLSWNSPVAAVSPPYQFQVLCADANGAPVPGRGAPILGYSTCLPGGVLSRRPLPTMGAAAPTSPVSGSVDDDPSAGGAGPFVNLDPKFVCGDPILASGAGGYSVRLEGFVGGQSYQLAVLAIDQAGNATQSAIVSAIPTGAADGGTLVPARGGCNCAAVGARSTPSLSFTAVLLLIIGGLARRRLSASLKRAVEVPLANIRSDAGKQIQGGWSC